MGISFERDIRFKTKMFYSIIIHRNHFIEYLCFLIRNNNIDPISILSTDDLEIVVRRANKRLPPRPYGMVDTFYRRELLKVQKN